MDGLSTAAPQTTLQHAARGDRVARTREAIVSSTQTLAQDGEVAPIVRDIAKLAGVSARTVFQHFADTAELYVAVLGRVLTTVTGGQPEINRQWPLDQRIGVVVNHRAERYETVRPMWTFIHPAAPFGRCRGQDREPLFRQSRADRRYLRAGTLRAARRQARAHSERALRRADARKL